MSKNQNTRTPLCGNCKHFVVGIPVSGTITLLILPAESRPVTGPGHGSAYGGSRSEKYAITAL